MGRYILGLDQGTTSSRAIVFDADGAITGTAQRELTQYYPHPGWVEHDPEEIWTSQREVAIEALRNAGIQRGDLAAMGITNQRETTVVWDRNDGRPLHRAIVWQDRRTASLTDQLRSAGSEAEFRKRTGLLLDPYFSGTKLHWILENVEGARKRAERGELAFGTVDSWLIWNLTGGKAHVTDATNASRTLLYNIHQHCWDERLHELLDIPQALLPEVVPSSGVCGEVSDPSLRGVPIAGVAGDQHAALFGQSCFEPGKAKNTYGTGCFLLMNTGDEAVASENNLLTTIAWQVGKQVEFALEGSVFTGGAVIQWLRDGLGILKSAAESEELAQRVEDNGGVYLVPAFSGLGAPHWDPYARGTITGITRGVTAAHLARAALESIALQSADVLRSMHRDSGIALKELRVDGGACVNNLLMQCQADFLGVPVVRPMVTETTALGAAALAGLAVGFWKDREAFAANWKVDRTFEPTMPTDHVEQIRHNWERAIARARNWADS